MATEAATARKSLQAEIGKKRPFDCPEAEAYLNLMRTFDRLSRAIDAVMRDHGVSQPLYNALRIVAGGGEKGVQHHTIAEHMVAHAPDVTRLVDRLEALDLVRRERCGHDRRVVWVHVTDAGLTKSREMEPLLLQLHREQLGHLGKAKLAQLNELLVEARNP